MKKRLLTRKPEYSRRVSVPVNTKVYLPRIKDVEEAFDRYKRQIIAIHIAQMRNPNKRYAVKEQEALSQLKERLNFIGLAVHIDWSGR